jgi:dienelactone hydrolase
MASAAYWIASQARAIYATPSAQVGSIGVVQAVVDRSAAINAAGIKVEVFSVGKQITRDRKNQIFTCWANEGWRTLLQSVAVDHFDACRMKRKWECPLVRSTFEFPDPLFREVKVIAAWRDWRRTYSERSWVKFAGIAANDPELVMGFGSGSGCVGGGIRSVMRRCWWMTLAVLSATAAMGLGKEIELGDSPQLSELRTWLVTPEGERKLDAAMLKIPLTRDEALLAVEMLAGDRLASLAVERKDEVEERCLVVGDKTLRWGEKTFGVAPPEGRSLWISLHGGGSAPQAVNDEQWLNQIRLYEPAEGVYVAPRAPTDTWNLWHEGHIDPMFQRLIEGYIAVRGVNPNKVYLLGYSAGGDGVWQVAPRMADRFAAAATMAGHPNGASLEGLRNLSFAIFMGGNDAAYDRNKVAVEMAANLNRLKQADPGGYVHMSRIYEGVGHWMNRKDAEALPWMAKFTRNPWPKKLVWVQDDVVQDRFYWLKIPDKSAAKQGQKILASVEGQRIRLNGEIPRGMALLLSDALLDLDEPVSVVVNGKRVSTGKIPRTVAAIRQGLEERLDVPAAASARFFVP